MMSSKTMLVIAAYLVLVVIAHGILYGTARANWLSIADETRTQDRVLSSVFCLFGPLAIIAAVAASWLVGAKLDFRLRTK